MKILIISDIHGNRAALEAVLNAEPRNDLTVCLGDLVDYGPDPADCVSLVRHHAQVVVMGNHDNAVGNRTDPGCAPAYRHLATVTRDFTIEALDHGNSQYLSNLPVSERFNRAGVRFSAVHASPTNRLYGYRPPETSDAEWKSEIDFDQHPEVLLLGHTHLPMVKTVGTTTILNPGSVGQPKDGDPRAAYAVWEDGGITLRRTEYDVEKTIAAFSGTGLHTEDVAVLAAILRSGGSEGP